MRTLALFITLLISGCAHVSTQDSIGQSEPIKIFVYPDKLVRAAVKSDEAVREKFDEIFQNLGRKGPSGEVGIAIVFPYLTWTEGRGKGPYQIPADIKKAHEAIVRVATQLKVPLLIQFNGAVWHSPSPDSAFLSHWKTVNGGKYLSRYQDGKVNANISETGPIPEKKLKKYLGTDPYDSEKGPRPAAGGDWREVKSPSVLFS